MPLTVQFVGGPQAGKTLEFDDLVDRIVIGRNAEQCQVVFPADATKVGRAHCALERQLGRIRLRLNAENAVFVDGLRAHDNQELGETVELQLGSGGPRLMLTTGQDVAYASTERSGQAVPGAFTLAERAGHSAVRARRAALAAFFSLVVLGSVGYVVIANLGKKTTEVRGKVTGLERKVSQLTEQQKLVIKEFGERIGIRSSQLEEAKPRLTEVLNDAMKSVYWVVQKDTEGNEMGVATAWVLDQHRGIMATNAHVAEVHAQLEAGDSLIVRSNADTPRDHVVDHVSIHPDYHVFSEVWAAFDPVAMRSAAYIERVKPAGAACDVALLHLEDSKGLAPALAIATVKKLNALAPGDPVGYIGYPTENLLMVGGPLQSPTPALHMGYVTAVTDFLGVDEAAPERRLLVQHSIPSAGGASGSPILNNDGFVVAVLSGGNVEAFVPKFMAPADDDPERARIVDPEMVRIGSAAAINFAQRADLLLELLDPGSAQPQREQGWRLDLERYYKRLADVETKQNLLPALAAIWSEWESKLVDAGYEIVDAHEVDRQEGTLSLAREQEEGLFFETRTVNLPTSGFHLLVAICQPQTQLFLRSARVHDGDLLPPLDLASPEGWVVPLGLEVAMPCTVDVDVCGIEEGSKFELRIWQAEVSKPDPAERRQRIVKLWLDSVASTDLSQANEERIFEEQASLDQSMEESTEFQSVHWHDVTLPAGGKYLAVASSNSEAKIAMVVNRQDTDEQELLSPYASPDFAPFGAFELAEPATVRAIVMGEQQGTEYTIQVYRAAPVDE